jgi:hypothetical protein
MWTVCQTCARLCCEDATPTRSRESRQEQKLDRDRLAVPQSKAERKHWAGEQRCASAETKAETQTAERGDQTAEREREREETEALPRASVATFLARSLLFVLTLAGLFSLSLGPFRGTKPTSAVCMMAPHRNL